MRARQHPKWSLFRFLLSGTIALGLPLFVTIESIYEIGSAGWWGQVGGGLFGSLESSIFGLIEIAALAAFIFGLVDAYRASRDFLMSWKTIDPIAEDAPLVVNRRPPDFLRSTDK